jgi:hypothetical protein
MKADATRRLRTDPSIRPPGGRQNKVILALRWLLEGAMLGAMVMAARRLHALWQLARTRVMRYPGPYAVATYCALEAMRVTVAILGVMVVAVSLGWSSLAVACLVAAVILQLVALCSVGLLMPLIAVMPGRRRNTAQSG